MRRWENERTAANLRAWVASGDGRAQGDRRVVFACECGRRGCAEQVRLTLAELDAGIPVLASGHTRW